MTNYDFYRDNKIAGHFQLSVSEIKDKYRNWLNTKEEDWVCYYGHQTVTLFIGDPRSKKGLQSVLEGDQIRSLEHDLMEVRHELAIYK